MRLGADVGVERTQAATTINQLGSTGVRIIYGILPTGAIRLAADGYGKSSGLIAGGVAALWYSGDNAAGETGIPTAPLGVTYLSPVQVGTLTNWINASGGYGYSIYQKNDYSLWSSGTGQFGQSGRNVSTAISSPVQIVAANTFKTFACGYSHTLAIAGNGALWAWGSVTMGQLGNNVGQYPTGSFGYSSPIQIGALTNWKQVAAANGSSAAIKTDGTLWTWGNNGSGQLGVTSVPAAGISGSYQKSPLQVGALTTWKQVACGDYNTMAIKTDGTLWIWGNNEQGQRGAGFAVSGQYYNSPLQVGALTTWSYVTCGSKWWVALKTDGTLWSCGYGGSGTLGKSTYNSYSSPVQIGALTTWTTNLSGNFTAVGAIDSAGKLWTWGNPGYGQLANGNNVNLSSPNQVGALTTWKRINLGHSATYLFK